MELHPISKITFYQLNGEKIEFPIEWEPTLLKLEIDPEEWDNVQVKLQQKPLELSVRKLNGKISVVAELSRLNPGRYSLALISKEQLEEYSFTVFPKKISEAAFDRLIEDLNEQLPVDIVMGLDRMSGFGALRISPQYRKFTLSQELERLKRVIYGTHERIGLIEILKQLSKKQHQTLFQKYEWTPRERVRRPDPTKLFHAFTRPQNVNGRLPLQVLDIKMEHTIDVYENRMVKLFVQQVNSRIKRVLEQLASRQIVEGLQMASEMRARIGLAVQQAIFLKEVTLLDHFIPKTTMVLLKDPPYRAALEGFLEFQRTPLIETNNPAFDTPLENLPYLYQYWSTLQVFVALLKATSKQGYKVIKQSLVTEDRNQYSVNVFRAGEEILLLRHPVHGTKIKFITEKSYSRTSTPIKSISFTQVPDISIVIECEFGRKLILFDPKYKLDSEGMSIDIREEGWIKGKPKKVDIDKMHAYRDAISDVDGNPIIHYAAILYPGKTVTYTDGLAAIKAYPGNDIELIEEIEKVITNIII
jgi:predicted component of viral defense system (DUF524 family)